MTTSTRIFAIAATLSLIVAAAVSASAYRAPATVRVVIENMEFSPSKVSVKVGDTIEWVNKDVVDHTSTGTKKEWDVTIVAGRSASIVVKKAGDVSYFCRFHPNMKGTVAARANR